MKKKGILNFIIWCILLLPFFRPDYLSRYEIVNSITNIWKMLSIFVAIIMFLKRGKLSKKMCLLLLFVGWILAVTIVNEGNLQLYILIATSIIGLAIMLENRNK